MDALREAGGLRGNRPHRHRGLPRAGGHLIARADAECPDTPSVRAFCVCSPRKLQVLHPSLCNMKTMKPTLLGAVGIATAAATIGLAAPAHADTSPVNLPLTDDVRVE